MEKPTRFLVKNNKGEYRQTLSWAVAKNNQVRDPSPFLKCLSVLKRKDYAMYICSLEIDAISIWYIISMYVSKSDTS